jgi:hydroxyacylglutathione hydrolase
VAKSIIASLHIGPEKNFTYLIACPTTGDAALIDPAFEFDRVLDWVKEQGKNLKVKYLLATHGHRDHSGGFPEMLKRLPDAKVVAQKDEEKRLQKTKIPLDIKLKDGEEFKVGKVTVKALHTPGHTEGGCCYIVEDQIFTGDTLFVGYVGRTDFEGGSNEELFKSLARLKTLPKTMIVRPGHDYGVRPTSTIGDEMKTNPAMMASTLTEFEAVP